MMTRRQFVTTSAAALAAPALGCGGVRPGGRPAPVALTGLDGALSRLLGLAALAPSSHNAQPWAVDVTGPRAFSIALDPARRLPMSQALEESPWREELAASLGLPHPIQLLVRVGYVDRYPEPASLRRSLASFVTT